MSNFSSSKQLNSTIASQKIGKPNQYGTSIYAWSEYGDDNELAGIYRNFVFGGKRYQQKFNFFDNPITHTVAQNSMRSKFSNAIIAWRLLSSDEKKRYNGRSEGRYMSGYNLFIREYMLYF